MKVMRVWWFLVLFYLILREFEFLENEILTENIYFGLFWEIWGKNVAASEFQFHSKAWIFTLNALTPPIYSRNSFRDLIDTWNLSTNIISSWKIWNSSGKPNLIQSERSKMLNQIWYRQFLHSKTQINILLIQFVLIFKNYRKKKI